jgi:tetratricopeptide (TPR) repeat protein
MRGIEYCPVTGPRCNKTGFIKKERDTFFLAEPFSPAKDKERRESAVANALKETLKDAFREASLRIADKEPKDPAIFCDICRMIQCSAYGIVDISGLNPNVLLELGMMFALSKPVFVLVKKDEEEDLRTKLPSDIIWKRIIPYEEFIDIQKELSKQLQNRPQIEPEPTPAEEAKKTITEIAPNMLSTIENKFQEMQKNFQKLLEGAGLTGELTSERVVQVPPSIEKQISEVNQKLERMETLLGPLEDPRTAFLRGNWHYNRKEYEKAVELYDWALTLKPDLEGAWFNKGFCLAELGKYNEAIESYDKALQIEQDNSEAWNNKGTALDRLGRYDEAIKCYDKAIQIKQDNSQAWNNKGIVLGKLGRYDEAIECHDKAIQIKQDNSQAWNSKGLALGRLGRWGEAKDCHEKSLHIDPNQIWVSMNLSADLLNLGESEKGLQVAKNTLSLAEEAQEKVVLQFLSLCAYFLRGESERVREMMQELTAYLRGLAKGFKITIWDFSYMLPTIEKLDKKSKKKLLSVVSLLKGEIDIEEFEKRTKAS